MEKQKISRMDIEEFQDAGYLQEVNRQFFHPLGLALEITVGKHKRDFKLAGIQDFRDDPEGVYFGDISTTDAKEKAKTVHKQFLKIFGTRKKQLGYSIQPLK
jgi:hypothetical protein